MQQKTINYGDTKNVTVDFVSEKVIICFDDVNHGGEIEAYVLIYHGLKKMPAKGDRGKVVFERDSKQGHWQYYPAK
jgi:hypothetical protein